MNTDAVHSCIRFCEYLLDTGKLSQHPPLIDDGICLKTRSSLKLRKYPPRRMLLALETAQADTEKGSIARAARRFRVPVSLLYHYRASPEKQRRLRRDAALGKPSSN